MFPSLDVPLVLNFQMRRRGEGRDLGVVVPGSVYLLPAGQYFLAVILNP